MPPWADRLALVSLAALVAAAPLAMSGVFPLAQSLCVAFAGLTAVLAGATDRAGGRMPAVVALGFGLVCWTVLQWIPLPCGLVAALSPLAAQNAERAADLAEVATTCRLSRAPGATLEEITKGLGILATLAAAWSVIRRGERALVIRCIAAGAITLAVVGMLHLLTRTSNVYGVVALRYAHPPIVSPLVNVNHLSVLLAVGVALSTGLFFAARNRAERWGWVIGGALCGVTALLTRSRAGTVAAAMAPLLVASTHWASQRGSSRRSWRAVLAVGIVTVVGLLATADLLLVTRAGSDYSKLKLAWSGLVVGSDAPLVGAGRGAFSSAFVAHAGASERFVYPENLAVQWITEWGYPVALLALGVLLRAVLRAWRAEISGLQRAALVAVVLLASHDLVDFSLESLGVALTGAALLTAATIVPSAPSPRERPPWWFVRSRLWVVGFGVAAALAGGTAATVGLVRVDDLTQELGSEAAAGEAGTLLRLRHAVVGLPEEPILALLGARWTVQNGHDSAGRWLTRAMALAPEWSGPHVLAAAWLARMGRPVQATLEVRQAARRQTNSPIHFLCGWFASGASRQIGIEAAPPMPARTEFLDALAACSMPRPADAAFFDEQILALAPRHIGALRRRAARARATGDLPGAVASLERLVALNGDRGARLDLVDGLIDAGQADRAETILRTLSVAEPEAVDVVQRQARLGAARGDEAAMRDALVHLRLISAESTEQLRDALIFTGRVEASRGQLARALRAYSEAYRVSGDVGALRALASTAEQAGDRGRALNAYADLCAHQEPTGCAARDRLERSITDERARLPQHPTGAPLDPPQGRR